MLVSCLSEVFVRGDSVTPSISPDTSECAQITQVQEDISPFVQNLHSNWGFWQHIPFYGREEDEE